MQERRTYVDISFSESDHLAINLVKNIINKLSDGHGGPIEYKLGLG